MRASQIWMDRNPKVQDENEKMFELPAPSKLMWDVTIFL